MRKLNYLFMAMLTFFIIPVFAGCGEEEIGITSVQFRQGTYSVVQGDTVQLDLVISPVEATNQIVREYAVIQGSEFISVDENGLVTANSITGGAKTARVQVTMDYGKMTATCYVKVLPEPIVLDTPTGLIYDASSSSLRWNAVTYVDTDQVATIPTYSAQYTLEISHDGGDFEQITDISNTSYAITESGSYVVRIKSEGDNESFVDSSFSQDYSFTILDTPTNAYVEDGVIYVDKISNVDGFSLTSNNYEIIVRNTTDGTTYTNLAKSENDSQIYWTIPNTTSDVLNAGQYEFVIRVLGDMKVLDTSATDVEFFSSDYTVIDSNTMFYQLGSATNITIYNNILSWDSVTNAIEYKIDVSEQGTFFAQYTYTTANTSWELSGEVLAMPSYQIRITAIGNGSTIITGIVSEIAKEKLGQPQNVSISAGVITWDAVSNASGYDLYLNNDLTPFTSVSLTSYTLTSAVEFNVGQNFIRVVATGSDDYNLDSDPGSLEITKLDVPVLSTTNGNIAWSAVSNATQYSLQLTPQNEQSIDFAFNNTTFSLALGSEYAAGNYSVTMQALGNNADILDSDLSVSTAFVKNSAPIITSVTENGVLSWQSGEYGQASAYQVYIYDSTALSQVQTFTTTQTSYNVSSYLSELDYGRYYFAVQSLNRLSSQAYLNSEIGEKVTTYKLNSPTGMGITGGMLSWNSATSVIDGVSFAERIQYVVQIDNNSATQTTTATQIAPSSTICYAGSHTARVRVVIRSGHSNELVTNNGTIFLISSDYSEDYDFVKLTTPNAPELNDQTLTGELVGDVTEYTIVIVKDGNETQNFSVVADSNGWTTTISAIFDEIVGSVGGSYTFSVVANGGSNYVSSDVSSSLEIYKISAPTLSINDSGEIEWGTVFSGIYGIQVPVTSYTIEYRRQGESDYQSYTPSNGMTNVWAMEGLDAGTYQIRIRANSNSTDGLVLSSENSDMLSVTKLEMVNSSTLAVSSSSSELTAITWDAVDDSNYLLNIYEIMATGNGSPTTETANSNVFNFGDNYSASGYYITIRATKTGYVSSDATSMFRVNRLSRVSNINILEDTTLTWDSVSNSSQYYVYSNSARLTTTTENSVQLVTNDAGLLGSNTGSFTMGIRAVIASDALNQINGVLTISSPISRDYNIVRQASPNISITNGTIVWSSSNATGYGYVLTFASTGTTETMEFDRNVTSYDMADLDAGIQYNVSIKALGNGGIYLDSPTVRLGGDTNSLVVKLSVPSYEVTNGVLSLIGADNNATSYTLIAQAGSSSITTNNLTAASDQVNVSVPSYATQGLSGEVSFFARAIGSSSVGTVTSTYYVSSDLAEFTIYKHNTPASLTVNNGEIEWTRAITDKYTTSDGQEYTILSGYNVYYTGNTSDSVTIGYLEDFILSKQEGMGDEQSVTLQVCAVGNSGGSTDQLGTVYLNSDYTNTLNVTIKGQPILFVEDGVLRWEENASATSSHSDYELILTLSGGDTVSILSSTRTNSLSEYAGQLVSSIVVRHQGTVSGTSSGSLFVNSRASTALTNVYKLAEPSASVNSSGELAWSGLNEVNGYTPLLTFFVNDEEMASQSDEVIFTLETVDFAEDELSQMLNIQGYAVGTIGTNYETTEEQPYLFLNSEQITKQAYMFAPVTSFSVEDGLKLVWDIQSTSYNDASNDSFIIQYKLGNSEEWSEMIVGDLRELALWEMTTYQARISVFSTTSDVIKSAFVDCSNANETEPFTFNKFAGGNGTRTNPFLIQTTQDNQQYVSSTAGTTITLENSDAETKLNYIKSIPTAYFKLMEDIELTAKESTESLTYLTSFTTFEDTDVVFTGGLDGNNFTISNYQVYSSGVVSSMFAAVEGKDEFTDLSEERDTYNFYGRSGIIMNLNLEVSLYEYIPRLTDSTNATEIISFIATSSYGGWFVNCHVTMSDELAETGILLDNLDSNSVIYYGGIVGYLTSARNDVSDLTESEMLYLDARIMNCSTDIDISITKNTNNLTSYSFLAGIVAQSYGATIYNCQNLGSLGGTQVAGIVGSANGVTAYTENDGIYQSGTYATTISGSENSGDLTSYPLTMTGASYASYSGGIVASLVNGNVYYCINRGNMIAESASYKADSTSSQSVSVTMGGVIGSLTNGNVINNINVGAINLSSRILTDTNSSSIGGLVGSNEGTSALALEYNYYDSTIYPYRTIGNATTASQGRPTDGMYSLSVSDFSTINNDENKYYDEELYTMPTFVFLSGQYPQISWVEARP